MKLSDEVLFKQADPVSDVKDPKIVELVDGLIAASIKIGGYGLAAPQVGISKQVFVYRKSIGSDKYTIIINPEIVVASGKLMSRAEGCLSHPGLRRDVKRHKTFVINYINTDGEKVRLKGSNKKESIILQHECEHLIGITIGNKK